MPVRRNVATLACSAVLAVSLPAAYLAMGGGSYEPSSVRNPCAERSWRDPGSFQALTIALATSSSRARFAREHHVDDKELGNAVRRGLERALDDAERANAIGGLRAAALRFGIENIPVEQMAQLAGALESLAGQL